MCQIDAKHRYQNAGLSHSFWYRSRRTWAGLRGVLGSDLSKVGRAALFLANVRGGEWLPNTIRPGYVVGIYHGDFEYSGVSTDAHGLIEIWQPHHSGAPIPPAPMTRIHTRQQTARASAATRSGSQAKMACVSRQGLLTTPRIRLCIGPVGRYWHA